MGNPVAGALAAKRYRLRHRAKPLIQNAKRRAEKRGLPFDLDEHTEALQARIDANRCEVTGLPFNLEGGRTWDSPSLDRIDPASGYVFSNVRVVLYSVNCALGDWGEETLIKMATAILEQREENFSQSSRAVH